MRLGTFLVVFLWYANTASNVIPVSTSVASEHSATRETSHLRSRTVILNSCLSNPELVESMEILEEFVTMYFRIGVDATSPQNHDLFDYETFTRYFGSTNVDRKRSIVHYRFRKLALETGGHDGRVAVDCSDAHAMCDQPQDRLSVPSPDFLNDHGKPYIYPIHILNTLNLCPSFRDLPFNAAHMEDNQIQAGLLFRMIGIFKDVFSFGGVGVFALREGGPPVDDPKTYYHFAQTIHLHSMGILADL